MSNDWRTLYESERDTVSRCWKALGIATYEQAGGKAIWEIIAEQQEIRALALDVITAYVGYRNLLDALGKLHAAFFEKPTACDHTCDHTFEQIDGQWGCAKCGSEMT